MNPEVATVVPVPGKGRGVIAAATLLKNTVLLCEAPLATFQLPESVGDVCICEACLRFVGPLRAQLALQCAPPVPSPAFASSPLPAAVAAVCDKPLPMLADEDQCDAIVRCEACGSTFCSTACLEGDAAHSFLCPVLARPAAAWTAFTRHCVDACETFLFGGRCVAVQAARALSGGSNAPFDALTRPLWWDIVPLPPHSDADAAVEFRVSLQRDAAMALELLSAALLSHPDPAAVAAVAPLLTLPHWGALLGTLTQNAVAVKISNPVAAYLSEVSGAMPHPAAMAAEAVLAPVLHCVAASQMIQEALDDAEDEGGAVSDAFMMECFGRASALRGRKLFKAAVAGVRHLQASGLYEHFSCFNHSCAPNCSVLFFEDSRVMVTTRSAVCEGEELTISYVDEAEEDREERQAELAQYGFVCDCPRCASDATKK